MSGSATEVESPVAAARKRLTSELLDELGQADHWSGELSSSALSTAVACIALRAMDRELGSESNRPIVERGLEWLARRANPDGGWGDTIRSKSNISTTALCWAAFGMCEADAQYPGVVKNAQEWLGARSNGLRDLPAAIAARYGKDRTFSVPILMTSALSGRLGPEGWRKVPPLPFEFAAFPRGWFGALRLPVVSYALPALIAIGQAIHAHAPSRNPIARLARNTTRARTLRLLGELQPANGGFLEATPLTAFVTMSLASAGQARGPVAQKAAHFLRESVRADSSWPIDTNLATWVTTLSIKALSHHAASDGTLETIPRNQQNRIRDWLLNQQYKMVHPYTGAAPGAWAWTDLPGGVPDADDTAGALLALYHLGDRSAQTIAAAEAGIVWLLQVQNSDGGIPTFCRGWGALPFDRSAPELTAHALRAWTAWEEHVAPPLRARLAKASRRALRFITWSQRPNGSFVPLWFGNEDGPNDENAVYGTAQVLIALNEISDRGAEIQPTARARAERFLAAAQHRTGGWGGDEGLPETVEETALALEALSGCPRRSECLATGAARLLEMIDAGAHHRPSPIGFYFARLWYYEKLYPLIFSVSALGRLKNG
jgi:squalene-hopene/tetraprenyl-beta-curcumene cyclase